MYNWTANVAFLIIEVEFNYMYDKTEIKLSMTARFSKNEVDNLIVIPEYILYFLLLSCKSVVQKAKNISLNYSGQLSFTVQFTEL